MNQSKLISLALNFTSFLIPRIRVDKVILYGSVAENTFDKESDIDLFIETEQKNQKKVESLLELYKRSKEYEKFTLEGIENDISLKCGRLDEWKGLKRSILSHGFLLFGRYEAGTENLRHKILFMITLSKKSKAEKVKVWRKIYGYRQKVGRKIYDFKGMAEKKIGKGAFLSSLEHSHLIKEYLRKNGIRYTLIDIWLE